MEPGAVGTADPEMALITGGGPSAVSFSPEPELRQADYSLLDTAMTHETHERRDASDSRTVSGKLLTKPNVNLTSF